MSPAAKKSTCQPRVLLVGDFEHPDFRDAVALLRADAALHCDTDTRVTPELMVIAHARPGSIDRNRVEHLRRIAPLAGVVALLGSWCEGQSRASRPVHDSLRLYWYEFPPWWRRQLAIRAAGRCPDWARPNRLGFQVPSIRNPGYPQRAAIQNQASASRGVIALSTPRWETADVLADVLRREGYATLWQPPGRTAALVRGAVAGVWEGGQLDDREVQDLAAFCRRLADDAAPVIALLDFPRRDRYDLAQQAGAAAVLGKPWINADLITTLSEAVKKAARIGAA